MERDSLALRSPDIDFFVSPYSYHFRGLGGDGLPMQPTESLRVHGKLYLFEEDTLMHNNLGGSLLAAGDLPVSTFTLIVPA